MALPLRKIVQAHPFVKVNPPDALDDDPNASGRTPARDSIKGKGAEGISDAFGMSIKKPKKLDGVAAKAGDDADEVAGGEDPTPQDDSGNDKEAENQEKNNRFKKKPSKGGGMKLSADTKNDEDEEENKKEFGKELDDEQGDESDENDQFGDDEEDDEKKFGKDDEEGGEKKKKAFGDDESDDEKEDGEEEKNDFGKKRDDEDNEGDDVGKKFGDKKKDKGDKKKKSKDKDKDSDDGDECACDHEEDEGDDNGEEDSDKEKGDKKEPPKFLKKKDKKKKELAESLIKEMRLKPASILGKARQRQVPFGGTRHSQPPPVRGRGAGRGVFGTAANAFVRRVGSWAAGKALGVVFPNHPLAKPAKPVKQPPTRQQQIDKIVDRHEINSAAKDEIKRRQQSKDNPSGRLSDAVKRFKDNNPSPKAPVTSTDNSLKDTDEYKSASAQAKKHFPHSSLKEHKLSSIRETGALMQKASRSGIPYEIIKEVYFRGLDEWTHNSRHTPSQHAFGRVNSFIAGGKARELDKDLLEGKK